QMDIFLQFIDLLRDEHSRRTSSSLILKAFIKCHEVGEFTNHLPLAHQLVDICRRLNESVEVSSPQPEIDQLSMLIESALDRFNFHSTNPEHALIFYVECRADMLNNDRIQKYTVVRILSLALCVIRTSKFTSARSTFLHACLA